MVLWKSEPFQNKIPHNKLKIDLHFKNEMPKWDLQKPTQNKTLEVSCETHLKFPFQELFQKGIPPTVKWAVEYRHETYGQWLTHNVMQQPQS